MNQGQDTARKHAPPLAAVAVGLALAIFASLARPAPQASAVSSLNGEEQAFLVLLNDYRHENGLDPLAVDWGMQSSSAWMSNDMGVNAYFSHTDSFGRSSRARMCAFDYGYDTWTGENIAAGYVTASEVFIAWKNSPDHNANMLGANYTVMGVSNVYVDGSPHGWYWTNDFGGVQSGTSGPTGDVRATPGEGRLA